MEGSLSLSLVGWRLLALASVSSGFIGQNWERAKLRVRARRLQIQRVAFDASPRNVWVRDRQ